MNLTLKTKIVGGFLLVVMFTLLVSGISFYMIGQMNATTKEISENAVPLMMKTTKVAKLSVNQVATLRAYLITGQDSYIEEYKKYSDEAGQIEDELDKKAITEQGRKFAQELKTLDEDYDQYLAKTIALKKAGKEQEAITLLREQATPVAKALSAKVEEYVVFREKQIENAFAQSKATGDYARTMVGIISVIALLGGIGIGIVISSSVVGALRAVTVDLTRLAKGDYSFTVPDTFLTGQIREDTDKAVNAMNEGTQEVKTGTEVVNEAGRTFDEIVSLIGRVSDQVNDISAAIEQMAASSQHIVGSVKEINIISKDASLHTQSVSAATEEQLASMEEIASSSQALAKMAEELRNVVSHFRV